MTPLCQTNEIPEHSSRGFCLGTRMVLVVQRHGRFFVYENRCPHRGISLEWQPDQFLDAEGHFIQCATHGALFRIEDGTCIAGPCNGQRLTAVAFELRDGQLWIT